MAKVAKRTAPAGDGGVTASPRSESQEGVLTAIYAIVGEFDCRVLQTEQVTEYSKKYRAQRITEFAAEASERLNELEARIFAHPDTQIKSEQTAPKKTRTAHVNSRENQAELAAIRTARNLLTLQCGKVQPKDRVWVRITDTMMGWVFVVGLFVWVYVLRLFVPNRN